MKSVKYVVLLSGILLVIMGIYREEVGIVLMKAINICFECIGVG